LWFNSLWRRRSIAERWIFAADADAGKVAWASKHHYRPNIDYESRALSELDGPFDLVVGVDVLPHRESLGEALSLCARSADRALLTAPNRDHPDQAGLAGAPAGARRGQAWSASELYWLCRGHFDEVELYAMISPFVPECVPIGLRSTLSPLIAHCRSPRQS
jgi:hypothetical protein